MKLKDIEKLERLKNWREKYQHYLSATHWDSISFSEWDISPGLEKHIRTALRDAIKDIENELHSLGVDVK